MKQKGKRALVILSSLLLTFSLCVTASYAWIRYGDTVGGWFSFTGREGGTFDLYQSYSRSGTYAWSKCEGNVGSGEFSFSDLHFGTVDNISTLKPENYFYLCLKIPEKLGYTVDFSFTYDELYRLLAYNNATGAYYEMSRDNAQYRSLYEGSGDTDPIGGLNGIHTAYGYIEFAAATSSSDRIADPSALTYTTPEANADGTFTVTATSADVANGAYCVYFRLAPNLAAYLYAVDYLSAYMPCIFSFYLTASFEVSNKTGA